MAQPLTDSTARSGRKDTWREANQKQYFWEHEKGQPTKTFIVPCRAADPKADFPLDDLQSGRVGECARGGRKSAACVRVSYPLLLSRVRANARGQIWLVGR